MKRLEEMSLQELWHLFPVHLEPHSEKYALWFEEEQARLNGLLPFALRISHIGSTAVKGIWAKPVVDILLEIPVNISFDELARPLVEAGYRCMFSTQRRAAYNKGYTETGYAQQVFHLHLRHPNDHDELYFRDYLCAHPKAAKEYERLKLHLQSEFEFDRDGYTNAKAPMVSRMTELGKREFENCYQINDKGDMKHEPF